jgi:hypothetical protein
VKFQDVVWSAVVAVACAVLSVGFAAFGDAQVSTSLAIASVTSALLANRER